MAWVRDEVRDVWQWSEDGMVTAEVSVQALAWSPTALFNLWRLRMRDGWHPQDIMAAAS